MRLSVIARCLAFAALVAITIAITGCRPAIYLGNVLMAGCP